MGPMRAACRFARELVTHRAFDRVVRVQVELYGSLALTGLGHGTDRAVLFAFVRPAGRTHLGVEVPYTPGKGKC